MYTLKKLFFSKLMNVVGKHNDWYRDQYESWHHFDPGVNA